METTISARSRNLGLGWNNRPKQFYNSTGGSYLGFAPASAPKAHGGLRLIEEELKGAHRINSGNDWTAALFVGGKRVVAARWGGTWESERMQWVEFGGLDQIHQLIGLVRDGVPVDVRTED